MKKELLLNTQMTAAFAPEANDGTAITGNIIERTNFLSAIMALNAGAFTGAPTNVAAVVTIYSGNAVDDEETPTSIDNETASEYVMTIADLSANSMQFLNIDLTGLGKYVRSNVALTFTGGTTPTALVSGVFALGDPRYQDEVVDAVNE